MHHLNRDQLCALLRAAREARETDWLILLVSFWHGLRASEAIALTPANFSDGYITVQRLKGSLKTTQPLVTDEDDILNERRAIQELVARTAPAERLFPMSRFQFYRLIRRYGRAAGLPQHLCHPHVLKHSIAKQSIRAAGIENVRQYLGHKSISSTGFYIGVDDDEAASAIAAATRKAPGVT